jgi:hypothetical protein
MTKVIEVKKEEDLTEILEVRQNPYSVDGSQCSLVPLHFGVQQPYSTTHPAFPRSVRQAAFASSDLRTPPLL